MASTPTSGHRVARRLYRHSLRLIKDCVAEPVSYRTVKRKVWPPGHTLQLTPSWQEELLPGTVASMPDEPFRRARDAPPHVLADSPHLHFWGDLFERLDDTLVECRKDTGQRQQDGGVEADAAATTQRLRAALRQSFESSSSSSSSSMSLAEDATAAEEAIHWFRDALVFGVDPEDFDDVGEEGYLEEDGYSSPGGPGGGGGGPAGTSGTSSSSSGGGGGGVGGGGGASPTSSVYKTGLLPQERGGIEVGFSFMRLCGGYLRTMEYLRSEGFCSGHNGLGASGHRSSPIAAPTAGNEEAGRDGDKLAAAAAGDDVGNGGSAHASERPPQQRPAGLAFAVGDVVEHRLFGRAVVVGWDPVCGASAEWIEQNGVDRVLRLGTRQPFYSLLLSDGTARYCSQENCSLVSPGQHREEHSSSSSSSSSSRDDAVDNHDGGDGDGTRLSRSDGQPGDYRYDFEVEMERLGSSGSIGGGGGGGSGGGSGASGGATSSASPSFDPIDHPDVPFFFDGFDSERGCHIPNEHVEFFYPADEAFREARSPDDACKDDDGDVVINDDDAGAATAAGGDSSTTTVNVGTAALRTTAAGGRVAPGHVAPPTAAAAVAAAVGADERQAGDGSGDGSDSASASTSEEARLAAMVADAKAQVERALNDDETTKE